jgi:hypothetical protein
MILLLLLVLVGVSVLTGFDVGWMGVGFCCIIFSCRYRCGCLFDIGFGFGFGFGFVGMVC